MFPARAFCLSETPHTAARRHCPGGQLTNQAVLLAYVEGRADNAGLIEEYSGHNGCPEFQFGQIILRALGDAAADNEQFR